MDTQIALWIAGFSYPAVFLLLVLSGVGAPVSEELVILTGGILVSRSGADFYLMALAAYLGILSGDSALYRIGLSLGPRVFSHPRLSRMMPPARVDLLRQMYLRRGAWVVFGSRFLPGLRAPAFLLAGATRLPYRQFVLADAAAAWIPALGVTWLGFRFGPSVLANLQGGLRWVLGAAVAVGVVWLVRRWLRQRRLVRAAQAMPPSKPEGV